jgi:hypothetical protein
MTYRRELKTLRGEMCKMFETKMHEVGLGYFELLLNCFILGMQVDKTALFDQLILFLRQSLLLRPVYDKYRQRCTYICM